MELVNDFLYHRHNGFIILTAEAGGETSLQAYVDMFERFCQDLFAETRVAKQSRLLSLAIRTG
jgi:hypothetical protein